MIGALACVGAAVIMLVGGICMIGLFEVGLNAIKEKADYWAK